ncbi:MAG TPA: hypothetical protein VKE74_11595 [Gemmataceae bacterium]|nr:hypothetical protein [Gemmataceae bacterium]
MFALHQPSSRLRVFALGVLATWAGIACGCGSKIPKTYPVTGKVIWTGGKPVTDGRIEFRSLSDESLKAVGEIESDGSFSLTTHRDGEKQVGAVEGQHKVIVEPEWGDDKLIFVLPSPYTVETRDNSFIIELRPPRHR